MVPKFCANIFACVLSPSTYVACRAGVVAGHEDGGCREPQHATLRCRRSRVAVEEARSTVTVDADERCWVQGAVHADRAVGLRIQKES